MNNFPADGIPTPDSDAALGRWHSTGAECCVVIYYSSAVRGTKTELQTKKPCSSLWSENREASVAQTSALSFLSLANVSAQLPVIYSPFQKWAINSICCENK